MKPISFLIYRGNGAHTLENGFAIDHWSPFCIHQLLFESDGVSWDWRCTDYRTGHKFGVDQKTAKLAAEHGAGRIAVAVANGSYDKAMQLWEAREI